MGKTKPSSELVLILNLIDEAFSNKSWHGTNLRGSLRGLSAQQAAWRPDKERKSIWEHVLHAAYWKYVVRRRLVGEKRDAFPLKGSNWISLPANPSEKTWREHIRLLERVHDALREAVASLSPKEYHATPAGSKISNAMILRGIALHDIYHTGQIQLLKRLTLRGR